MPQSPIFVIGAARSGTKFLRDCLRGDERIAAVPYDVNYIWRYGQPNDSDDVLLPGSIESKQASFIRRTIEGQARLKDGKVLLEKTVSNSLRVPFVEAVFPGARYVHLVRDGRDVATSAIKEWSAPPDYRRLVEKLRRLPLASLPYLVWYLRNSVFNRGANTSGHVRVWGPRYPGIHADLQTLSLAQVCAIQWKKSVDFARADLAALPSERVFHIRYEDLVQDRSVIAQLATALDLDSASITRTWEQTVSPAQKRPLTTAQLAIREEIETIQATTLGVFGY
jgi:hypothetical protein